jgi:pimeloyl-ACP methyl ester carboxylesterase
MRLKITVNDHSQEVFSVQYSDQGPTLFFLHQMLGDHSAWTNVIPLFAPDYKTFALDLRGHGKSLKPIRGYRWREDLALDVARIIKRVSDSPAFLVGHSLGAMVCAALAADQPELVKAVVLEDPPAFDHSLHYGFFRKRLKIRELEYAARVEYFVSKGQAPKEAEISASWYENWNPGVLKELIEGTALFKTEEIFPKIQCPVLLLLGNPDKGGVLTFEHRKRISTLIPHLTISEWKDCGHGIHDAEPEAFTNEIKKFLAYVERPNR